MTFRLGVFVLACAIASSSSFARSDKRAMIDLPPDHTNLWMASPLPWGEARLVANLAALAFAPKITIATFVASVAAGVAADRHYGTGQINSLRMCQDEEKNRAEVMATEKLRTSYLYCYDKSSSQGRFAVDEAGKAIEVTGRWGRQTYPFQIAMFTQTYSSYGFVVEATTLEGLRERCAATLGINSVSVRVKDTSYTTKISGYEVVSFSEKQRDGSNCFKFIR